MHAHSSVQSIQSRQVTILAIAETILAIVVAVFAAKRGLLGYSALTALAAPFLLLRTERSVHNGLRWLQRGLDAYGTLHWTLVFVLFIPFILLYSLAVKVLATTVTVLKSPVESIIAIPSNWFLQVLCVDSWHPPEIVPGIETAASRVSPENELSLLTVRGALREIRSPEGWDRLAASLFLVSIAPAFIAAFIYRLTLKSTALVWAPLLWIVPKLRPTDSLQVRIRLLNATSWGRFVFWTSILVVLAFAAKVLVYNGIIVLSQSLFLGTIGLVILD